MHRAGAPPYSTSTKTSAQAPPPLPFLLITSPHHTALHLTQEWVPTLLPVAVVAPPALLQPMLPTEPENTQRLTLSTLRNGSARSSSLPSRTSCTLPPQLTAREHAVNPQSIAREHAVAPILAAAAGDFLSNPKLTRRNSADKAPASEGFPFRKWNVKIYILDQAGKEHKADCFQKVVFNLHPSFADPVQSEYLPCPLCYLKTCLLTAMQPSPFLPSPARMRAGVSSRCTSTSTTPTRAGRSPSPTI